MYYNLGNIALQNKNVLNQKRSAKNKKIKLSQIKF